MHLTERLNANVLSLSVAQAGSVTGTVALITLGGIVGYDMAPVPALATLPMSLLVVGTALATVFAAWTMSRIGRARGFALGAGMGCVGAACALGAMIGESFVLFCAAAVLVGAANAFAHQYRFAAAESVPASAAGWAVSIALAGSLVGAVLGPELAARGEYWVEGARFAGTFAAIAVCYVCVGAVLLRLEESVPPTPSAAGESVRGTVAIARNRVFIVAVLGGAVGYGVMTFTMTAAPLSMHVVEGHSLAHTATVIQAHVLAMYAPSLVTGYLIGKAGARRVMLVGAGVLCITVIVGFAGREVLHYGASMVALGVGWNFLYVGGTTLLGSAHRPEERFRAQAINDSVVFGISATASLGAGVVMQLFGWNIVLGMSIPAIALAIAALAWVRPQTSPARVGSFRRSGLSATKPRSSDRQHEAVAHRRRRQGE